MFRMLSRVLLSLFALGCAVAVGQESSEETFRADTRLVVLHASVVDKNGRLLTNLQRPAFKVFENNIEQPIKTFRREDVPVSLALVIDNSGSMRNKRKAVEAAALSAIKASNPRDEVTVINFNDEPYQDVEFTGDVKKMEEGLTRIDARGGTAMRDAISVTLDYMKRKAKHDKKVLFVITDGDDTASQNITLEKLVQKSHDADDVLLYFVGLLSDEDRGAAKRAKRAMQALATASGGSAVFPETADVENVAVSLANEIRNQYIITYSPTNPSLDGSFRAIRVIANGPNKPSVRTRSGYYATPEPARRSAASTPGATAAAVPGSNLP